MATRSLDMAGNGYAGPGNGTQYSLERSLGDPNSVRDIAIRVCGDPNARLSSATELRFGKNGSLSIDLGKATFYDHEHKVGGGLLELIRRKRGVSANDAVDWLTQEGLLHHSISSGGRAGRISKTYDYHDERGVLRLQVVRMEPKRFLQRQPDGRSGWKWGATGVPTLPYRLPELMEAIAGEKTIFVLEGEKDVDRAWALGIPATCNAGGAKKFRADHAVYLHGADVVIVPDNDAPGQHHQRALAVTEALSGVARRIRLLELPGLPLKGDFSDWADAGHTVEEFWDLAANARDVTPGSGEEERNRLQSISVASFAGKPVPPREWHVRDLLPAKNRTVSLVMEALGSRCSRRNWLLRRLLDVHGSGAKSSVARWSIWARKTIWRRCIVASLRSHADRMSSWNASTTSISYAWPVRTPCWHRPMRETS